MIYFNSKKSLLFRTNKRLSNFYFKIDKMLNINRDITNSKALIIRGFTQSILIYKQKINRN